MDHIDSIRVVKFISNNGKCRDVIICKTNLGYICKFHTYWGCKYVDGNKNYGFKTIDECFDAIIEHLGSGCIIQSESEKPQEFISTNIQHSPLAHEELACSY